jgi:hypothetical protein
MFQAKLGPVLRIRDVYPGSRIRIFPSQIPDPNFSIPDPGSASKNLRILIKKIVSNLSEIYQIVHTGSGSRSSGTQFEMLPTPPELPVNSLSRYRYRRKLPLAA